MVSEYMKMYEKLNELFTLQEDVLNFIDNKTEDLKINDLQIMQTSQKVRVGLQHIKEMEVGMLKLLAEIEIDMKLK